LPVFKHVTQTVRYDSFEALSTASRMGWSIEEVPRGDIGGESCEDEALVGPSPKLELREDERLMDGRCGARDDDRGDSRCS
jgi:hypothetical protein